MTSIKSNLAADPDRARNERAGKAQANADLSNLIVATARGDRAAFRILYDTTSPKLLGVVLRILRSRAEAEEVVQDTYIRVWKSAGSFVPGASAPISWLASIARNRAIDVVRVKRPTTLSSEPDESDWMERIADPRDDAAEIANRDALRLCLGTVEEPIREMVVLAYCEGLSREELAQRYGSPVNTIKTWLHRALASLKTCLDEKA